MRIFKIGDYTIVKDILDHKGRRIRQLYKGNRMLQFTESKRFIKRTVVDTSKLETLYTSLKDKASGIIKVLKDVRGKGWKPNQ